MSARTFIFAAALLLAAGRSSGETPTAVRIDFDRPNDFEREWSFHSSLTIINKTTFHLRERPTASNGHVLLIDAKSASGVICSMPEHLDLNKFPIMRWRWRIIRNLDLPEKDEDPDDQPGVIYVGDGSRVRQYSVGYRWECNTPVGRTRFCHYRGGLTTVRCECVRNRETPIGQWVEEERNVLEDFKEAFKRPPSDGVVLGIGANSQHSRSHTRLEIDYIEFIPAAAPEK